MLPKFLAVLACLCAVLPAFARPQAAGVRVIGPGAAA
ncbi:MAG: hypothetical protein FD180_5157, partial [Planctomycetota bacterium]